MWKSLITCGILSLCAAPAHAGPPALSPLDPSLLDAGCAYSRTPDSAVFLLWLATPIVPGGPTALHGVNGESLPMLSEQIDGQTLEFRGGPWRVRVFDGEAIEQDCGEACAGSLRRVQVELIESGGGRQVIEAVEHCGC